VKDDKTLTLTHQRALNIRKKERQARKDLKQRKLNQNEFDMKTKLLQDKQEKHEKTQRNCKIQKDKIPQI